MAKQRVAVSLAPQKFVAPGPPFDMGKAKGKTVWFIGDMSIPYAVDALDALKDAAAYVGVHVVGFDGKSQTSTEESGIEEAISAHANAIWLQAVDPAIVDAAVHRADAAKIPVIDSNDFDPSTPPSYGVYAHAGYSTDLEGRRAIDYGIAATNGHMHALFVTTPNFVFFAQEQTAMEQEMKTLCPACTMKIVQFAFPTIASQVPLEVRSAVASDPSINFVIPAFDQPGTYAEQGLSQAGKTGSVSLEQMDDDTADLSALKKGDSPYAMDQGSYAGWDGWAAMDLLGRAMTGQPAPKDPYVPSRTFTKSSPPADPSGNWTGTNYEAGYKALWKGLS